MLLALVPERLFNFWTFGVLIYNFLDLKKFYNNLLCKIYHASIQKKKLSIYEFPKIFPTGWVNKIVNYVVEGANYMTHLVDALKTPFFLEVLFSRSGFL